MGRSTKLQRWIDLIACLVGRRLPVSRSEIMERVPAYADRWEGDESDRAAARRMFERDKDELRDLGIPIETVTYSVSFGTDRREGYELAREDFYLPYLEIVSGAEETAGRPRGDGPAGRVDEVELEREEAAASVEAARRAAGLRSFPLRREARSALRKLTFDLADDVVEEAPVHFTGGPEAEAAAGRVREIGRALMDRKRVRFRYRGVRRREETRRDVAPYGLFFQHGHWYLVGPDARRDGERRVFRADRMEEVEPNPERPQTPDYEIPDDFSVADLLDREAWELGDEEELVRAEVLFRFPASLRVERQGRGEPVERREDGSSVRRFEVRQPGPFLRWLLTFGGEAEVLSPAELGTEMRAAAREIVGRHTGPTDRAVAGRDDG